MRRRAAVQRRGSRARPAGTAARVTVTEALNFFRSTPTCAPLSHFARLAGSSSQPRQRAVRAREVRELVRVRGPALKRRRGGLEAGARGGNARNRKAPAQRAQPGARRRAGGPRGTPRGGGAGEGLTAGDRDVPSAAIAAEPMETERAEQMSVRLTTWRQSMKCLFGRGAERENAPRARTRAHTRACVPRTARFGDSPEIGRVLRAERLASGPAREMSPVFLEALQSTRR